MEDWTVKYKYIQDIISFVEENGLEVSPITFYADMESLRVARKGGDRELAAAIFASVVLTAIRQKQANHALWYLWFKNLGDTTDEAIDKTVEVIKSISVRRAVSRIVPFGEVIEAASEVIESLCSLLKKYKGKDPEISGAIIAQFMENWAKDSRVVSKLTGEEKDE
jgi:hypothetical protein